MDLWLILENYITLEIGLMNTSIMEPLFVIPTQESKKLENLLNPGSLKLLKSNRHPVKVSPNIFSIFLTKWSVNTPTVGHGFSKSIWRKTPGTQPPLYRT